MEDSIFAQIRRENGEFFNNFITPVPGYEFNQYTTIKRCHLYHNSKYEDSSKYLGRDKLFFNVVNPPCEVATKMLNVDTKNIRLFPLNSKSHFATYLLEKELKQWLKTSEFAETLNKLAEELPVYGSVVLEKTKKGAKVVDIRRLILDPTVDSVEDSRFVTTIHYMTPTELRATGWDNVEEAIERFGTSQAAQPFEDARGDVNQQDSTPYIKVVKRYGEVPEKWIKGTSEKMTRSIFIVAGADKVEVNNKREKTGVEAGVVLFKSAWTKEWPYRDFHYTRVKGRWLGMGVIEMLFDVQVRMNELKNQKRISMEISSMHLFQTKDKQIVRNILTDLESGDLLQSTTGIEPIVNEERNLAAFKDEEASYSQQAERLSFAYEAVRGETPPSSTPLGTTQIATAQATSVFAFKRENVSIAYREFFNELVMPQLIADLTPEHVMRFTGDSAELMSLDQAAAELYANDVIKESILAGRLINPEVVELAKKKAMDTYRKMGSHRFIKMKQAFYGDAEFDFDYVIDNEQVDPQYLVQNLGKVIQDLATNPTILDDPRLKVLYFEYAQNLGVSAAKLEMADEQAQRMKTQAESLQANQPQQPNGKPKTDLFKEAAAPATAGTR